MAVRGRIRAAKSFGRHSIHSVKLCALMGHRACLYLSHKRRALQAERCFAQPFAPANARKARGTRCRLEMMLRSTQHDGPLLAGILFGLGAAGLAGCASPAAPKPPSLHLPAIPKDLAVVRHGDEVDVSFTPPSKTTDGLLLRGPVLQGEICIRSDVSAKCVALPLSASQRDIHISRDRANTLPVNWDLRLPEPLRSGPVAAAALEVEILSTTGKAAGWSAPVWFATGAAPQAVADLQAIGTRQGTLLRWQPVHEAGEVLLQKAQPKVGSQRKTSRDTEETTTLQADPGNSSASETLDPSMQAGVPVRYTAFRRRNVQIGGHSLELRSASSAPATFTWRDVYPPKAPTDLKAVGYQDTAGAGFAIDLIWEPVEDARVTGYLVTRTVEGQKGDVAASPVLLTHKAVVAPAFQDTTAKPGASYRYAVTAVDAAGNQSLPATTAFEER